MTNHVAWKYQYLDIKPGHNSNMNVDRGHQHTIKPSPHVCMQCLSTTGKTMMADLCGPSHSKDDTCIHWLD